MGQHYKHRYVVTPPPTGPDGETGLGGAVCDCQGDCVDESQDWFWDLWSQTRD